MQSQDTLYCFSCGRSVPSGQAVPFCAVCVSAGPQLSEKSLRWVVRGGKNLPRGSLAREEVIAMLVQDVMGEDVEIAREGGHWSFLVAHPDYRSIFLPGTEQHRAYREQRRKHSSEQRSISARQKVRMVAAVAIMVSSLGLAAYSANTGLLTVPEPIADRVSSWFATLGSQVNENVDLVSGNAPAIAPRTLQGEELFDLLPEPARDEPLPVLLQSGWAAWWTGTDAGLAEARVAFESAAVRAPDDVEALGGLVEVYSALLNSDPDLKDAISYALARMATIDSQAVATLRARAADAQASGQTPRIDGLLASCGSPIEGLFDTVDLNCAVRLAEARRDVDTLAELQARTGSVRIALIRARAAVALEDWGAARTLSQALVTLTPEESEPWSLLAQSTAAVGDWRAADTAAAEAIRRAPHRLHLSQLRAQIQSRVMGRHTSARAVLDGIIASEYFAQYPERISVYNDAAEVAFALNQVDTALQLAEQAVALDPTHPVALLQQAWALNLKGDAQSTEDTLRRVDAGQLLGTEGARLHLGIARIYLAMDNQRSAVDEIQNALRGDSALIGAVLDGALADVRVNNLDGAVEKITRAPLNDAVYVRNLSPLVALWIPPPDLDRLKNEMGTALANDVRYSVRIKEILAIIDWCAEKPSAEASLRTAVAEGGTAGASAALAQQLFGTNRPSEGLKHVNEVLTNEADNPIFLSMRGYAQAVSGASGSERALGRALSLEPMNPAVLYWNAAANEALGKNAEAIRLLEALMLVSPNDVTTRARLISLSAE